MERVRDPGCEAARLPNAGSWELGWKRPWSLTSHPRCRGCLWEAVAWSDVAAIWGFGKDERARMHSRARAQTVVLGSSVQMLGLLVAYWMLHSGFSGPLAVG